MSLLVATSTRRAFIVSTSAAVAAALAPRRQTAQDPGAWPRILEPAGFAGGCRRVEGPDLIPGALWYEAAAARDGIIYRFPAGTLHGMQFLTAEILADGHELPVFELVLGVGEDRSTFSLYYGVLPHAEARMRMRADAVSQNRWQFRREGAWLKPMAAGAIVDLARVDRMRIHVLRKGDRPVRWCQTPLAAAAIEPPRLTTPRLPRGVLIDAFGQSATREWPGKTRSEREIISRLREQFAAADTHRWPAAFSAWGGQASRTVRSHGYFRTHNDGRRWWLLDPDGHPFWSAGLVSVTVDTAANYDGLESALSWLPPADGPFAEIYNTRPDGGRTINYLAANFIRAFGPGWRDRWGRIVVGEMRRLGFNTVANWSDWEVARAARFPYVRPLAFGERTAPFVFRDFPDVFDERFAADAARFGAQLASTRDDPAFIGYFLMNEPTWGFARQTPAAGMLFNTSACPARRALREALTRKYRDDQELSQAWGFETTLAATGEGVWTRALSAAAERDLADFSAIMVERLFGTLSAACRTADPNHLNLGIRYHTVPPPWAVGGMKSFDVFSMNCYESRVKAVEMERVANLLGMPVMVGEWHFGALDVGLPASGIGRVASQHDRARAYRLYLEDAAARPWCVGVHYFILYDQSALGRFDGECYNIGFYDVCHRPYEPLCDAARTSHERLYAVANGETPAFDSAPEYLPKLYL